MLRGIMNTLRYGLPGTGRSSHGNTSVEKCNMVIKTKVTMQVRSKYAHRNERAIRSPPANTDKLDKAAMAGTLNSKTNWLNGQGSSFHRSKVETCPNAF